jgi:hypothetical protein
MRVILICGSPPLGLQMYDPKCFYMSFSNASQSLYPDNTIAAFTIELSQTNELGPKEKWKVDCTNIVFPN